MPMNWAQLLEDIILGKIVTALMDNGFRVVISDQDGGGLHVYGIADNGETAPDGKYDYWVRCVPGNGDTFISDYTTNLETVLAPVNAFSRSVE